MESRINTNESNEVRNHTMATTTRMNQDYKSNITQATNLLNQILSDPSLKICYKCKQDFSSQQPNNQVDDDGAEIENEGDNILFGGLVLAGGGKTLASICLNCLGKKMLDSLTDQFFKNNKDYYGLFSGYKEKYKV